MYFQIRPRYKLVFDSSLLVTKEQIWQRKLGLKSGCYVRNKILEKIVVF